MKALLELLGGDRSAERTVPPSGFTATLTVGAAAAMAFLAVFVLALASSAGRLATEWEAALAGTATVRITGAGDDIDAQADLVEAILAQTPGVAATRRIPDEEQAALLAPWFGDDLPLENLRLPALIEVETEGDGPDAEGLRQRLAAEAPGAVWDDHARWRAPMVEAARGLRRLANLALVLIGAVTAAMVALAASASLAANGQVIDVLRLVGAEDAYIVRAFTRRFTLRALGGAAFGTVPGMIAVALLPSAGAGFPAGIGFAGVGWLLPLALPPVFAALAFLATRLAAARRLAEVS